MDRGINNCSKSREREPLKRPMRATATALVVDWPSFPHHYGEKEGKRP